MEALSRFTKITMMIVLVLLVLSGLVTAQIFSRGPGGPKPAEPGRRLISDSVLMNKIIKSPLFWILTIAAVFWIRKYPEKKRNKQFIYLGFAIVIGYIAVISLLGTTDKMILPVLPSPDISREWMEAYQRELPPEYKKYTVETEYYDYSHPVIQELSTSILSVARNEREFVQLSLDAVYEKVIYNTFEDDATCFEATGSSVIESKTGQCDSMSLSIISLLRSAGGKDGGIAARTVGGCLSLDPKCKLKMALFALLGIEEKKPKWRELGEIDMTKPYFSRGSAIPRAGGLHLWVTAYFDANGDGTKTWNDISLDGKRTWNLLEVTSGEIVREDSCYRYDFELYPDETSDERTANCVSVDSIFATWCSKR